MAEHPLTVAWVSLFPVEWLPGIPAPIAALPRTHPAPWKRVLLAELNREERLKLHVFTVRKHLDRHRVFELDGATFHCLKVPGGMRTLSFFWWETLLIRRRLRQIQPDVVQAWGCERGAALVASRLGYPYFVSVQGLLEWIMQRVSVSRLDRLEAWLERISLKRTALATAESAFSVNWLREHYPHLEVHHIEHAPNWLFHHIQRRPETRPVQLLANGIISALKGTDLLLLALDQLREELDFRLTIIGSYDSSALRFLDQMRAMTSPALWERVTVRTGLTQEQVAQELSRATLFVMPSRADTGPTAVKEAAVAGVPVIGSRVGGIPDYITPGQNGLLFPVGDLPALTRALRVACTHPLFSQGTVDPDALARVRDHLSPRRMAKGFLALYPKVAALKADHQEALKAEISNKS